MYVKNIGKSVDFRFFVMCILLISGNIIADDWPNWRGPDHNGISNETGWSTNWSKEGPKVLWKASLGTGFSSIAVSKGRVYAMGNTGTKKLDEKEHKDIVFCFDEKTGKELWRHQYSCPLNPRNYEGGPSATPNC